MMNLLGNIKLHHANGEFDLELPAFIYGDGIDLSLQLGAGALRMRQAPGRSFCLSLR